jgi:serine/threonine-protein kinase RsbW
MIYRDLAMRMIAAACKLVVKAPTPDFDDQVVSAFSEAWNNAICHAYVGGRTGDVEIQIEPHADRLIIRLLDWGKSFDLRSVPSPDLDSLPESGLGVFIIRSFMDDVDYTAGRPNTLTMTKSLLTSSSAAGT